MRLSEVVVVRFGGARPASRLYSSLANFIADFSTVPLMQISLLSSNKRIRLLQEELVRFGENLFLRNNTVIGTRLSGNDINLGVSDMMTSTY